jgi:hypothetical protein
MKAIDLIRWAMRLTDEGIAAMSEDMRDAPLTRPVSRDGVASGNHPLWILGHLAYMEGRVREILFGEANPVAHWGPLFAAGSQPGDDPGVYPTFDEALGTLRALRAANLRMLEEIGEAGLDRVPRKVPAGFEDVMTTFGHTLLLITLHQMVHYGQMADARRAAGRPPLL